MTKIVFVSTNDNLCNLMLPLMFDQHVSDYLWLYVEQNVTKNFTARILTVNYTLWGAKFVLARHVNSLVKTLPLIYRFLLKYPVHHLMPMRIIYPFLYI